MGIRRRAVAIGTSGLAGLALVAFAFQVRRPSASAPVLSAAAVVQEGNFIFDPDTMVGYDVGPAQPVFFSHRRHAGVYEMECLYCHSNTDISPVAPMPSVDLCIGCHRVVKAASTEIQKLRGYEQNSEPIPWERIYKVADYVQFNHGRHIVGEVECQECHGDVEEYDVLWQWSPLTMGWCLECHTEAQEDALKLAQAEEVAAEFGDVGRESHGLYPRSIDSNYAVLKGPIDCAACHY
jgi:hypothetical protein